MFHKGNFFNFLKIHLIALDIQTTDPDEREDLLLKFLFTLKIR